MVADNLFADYLARKHGVGGFRKIRNAIQSNRQAIETSEFIRVPTALEAETLDETEIRILVEDRKVEKAGFRNRFRRIIRHVDGKEIDVRLIADLDERIVDGSVGFAVFVLRE